MAERIAKHKTPKEKIELEISPETLAILGAMAERKRVLPDVIVEQALQEKAQREGVLESVRAREDLKEAYRRVRDFESSSIPWEQVKLGDTPPGNNSISFKQMAVDEWKSLPLNIRMPIVPQIDKLADNPYPAEAEPMKGMEGLFLLRSGRHHVIYFVRGQEITVLLIKSGQSINAASISLDASNVVLPPHFRR